MDLCHFLNSLISCVRTCDDLLKRYLIGNLSHFHILRIFKNGLWMASVALYADRSYSCGFEPTTQCKEVKADKIFLV